jgi:hypothetical protein
MHILSSSSGPFLPALTRNNTLYKNSALLPQKVHLSLGIMILRRLLGSLLTISTCYRTGCCMASIIPIVCAMRANNMMAWACSLSTCHFLSLSLPFDISPSLHSPPHVLHLKAHTSIPLIHHGHLGSNQSSALQRVWKCCSSLAGIYFAIVTIV